jgi:multiple sugar transport system permease protein
LVLAAIRPRVTMSQGDLLHVVAADDISAGRRRLGRAVVWGSALVLAATAAAQTAQHMGLADFGFRTWRPTLYAYILWAACLCWSKVLAEGEHGKRTLFVLPAALFVVSLTVFPLLFGLVIAFSSWNLSSPLGRQFNGLDNVRQMWSDPFYWNALRNMVWYCLAILVEYAVAFGLALLLNSEIKARKFFRVAFLLPLMLSPVAVSWMIGKSMLELRFGPVARFARWLGWDNPSLFGTPEIARFTIMLLDAWTFIPFMMIMILAGLQAIPKELTEAARVDGASPWKSFWEVTFPLMIPVSVTAILIRIIFKLKLADIVINLTAGGPGGATDTVTSFIFREYRDRSNVGYGTLLAIVYLVIIIIVMTLLMKLAERFARPRT